MKPHSQRAHRARLQPAVGAGRVVIAAQIRLVEIASVAASSRPDAERNSNGLTEPSTRFTDPVLVAGLCEAGCVSAFTNGLTEPVYNRRSPFVAGPSCDVMSIVRNCERALQRPSTAVRWSFVAGLCEAGCETHSTTGSQSPSTIGTAFVIRPLRGRM